MRGWGVRTCADVWLSGRCSRVVDGCLRVHGSRCAAVRVLLLHAVASRRGTTLGRRLATEVVRRSPLATSWLRNIRDNLHAPRNNTSGSAAASSVC